MTRSNDKSRKLSSLESGSRGRRTWNQRLKSHYLLRPPVISWIINMITGFLVLVLVSHPEAMVIQDVYSLPGKEGEPVIAIRDFKIPKDLEVPDVEGTEKKKAEAAVGTPAIYDWDPMSLKDIKKKVFTFFEGFRELYPQPPELLPGETTSPESGPIKVPPTFMSEKEQKLLRDFGVNVAAEDMETLKSKYFAPEFETAITGLVESVYNGKDQNSIYVVPNKDLLLKDRDRGIMARAINAKPEDPLIRITNLDSILDIGRAQEKIDALAPERLKGLEEPLRQAAVRVAKALLEANLTFNKNKTEEARAEAVAAVLPRYYKFKQDEIIVRKGDRLGPETIKKIDAIVAAQRTHGPPSFKSPGLYLLIILLMASLIAYAGRNVRKFHLDPKDMAFLAMVLVISLAVLKGVDFLSRSVQDNISSVPAGLNFYYLVPLAGAAMLARMVLNSEVALVFSIVLAIFGAMVTDNSLIFGIYTLVGSVIAAGEVRQCRQRSAILRAGLVLGIVNVLLILVLSVVSKQFLNPDSYLINSSLLVNSIFGLVGGVFVAIMITGLVPAAESFFSYATDIKLLELLNQDHPLLKELSMRAPGTHMHCLMVANLAEAAAKSINANPLLARVCAIYHDIGKINKPLYFAENQFDGNNVHKTLAPSMSTLIIHNHVKEGAELAVKYKLPRVVIEAIQQHHGTSLLNFFFEKAKELGPDNPVDEIEFRYPGPKPQTREAAIIMLADVVESAARTVRDPSPARLRGMVQKLINRHFIDGQLDECDLTLKNLHDIARSFNMTLGAVYHHRPDYPQSAVKGTDQEKKKKADQDAAKSPDKSSGQAKNGEDKNNKESEDYLKRLGM